MFGLDDYYSGLIEEAKSPEEIKKILEYQFVQGKGIPRHVFVDIFNIDPTKKKSYTRWVLMQYDKYREEICRALVDGRLERMFKTFKERAGSGLDLTNIESFPKALEYIPDVDTCLDKDGDPNSPENDFEIAYKTNEWVVAIPHTYAANRKLGQGCRWCTAGAFGDNDYYWNRYSSAGPLFVNFDKRKPEIGPTNGKEYPYTRYQFLFEWQNWTGELMDSDDRRVDFEKVDMPEDVVEFYGSRNEKYKEMIEGNGGDPAERWEEYNEGRYEASRTILNIDEMQYLSLMPEQNDDYDLDVNYMLYDEEDTSDSPFSNYFDPDDCLICKSSDGKAAVLKDIRNDYVLVYWQGNGRRWRGGSFELANLENWWNLDGVFVATDGSDIFCLPKNNGDDLFTHASCSEITDDLTTESVFVNSQVSRIAQENGIEGYYGVVLEIASTYGTHSLCMYDGANIIPMILRDYPINEEQYVAEISGDRIIIQGKRYNHKFGEGGESDAGNLTEVEEIGEVNGHEYYIVRLGNNANSLNLYDANEKKLVFGTPYANMSYLFYNGGEDVFHYVVCQESENGPQSLYWIDQNRFVVEKCSHVVPVFRNSFHYRGSKFLDIVGGDGSHTILNVERGFEPIVKALNFDELSQDSTGAYLLVKLMDNTYNVINLETGKPTINDKGFINWGKTNDRTSKVVLFQKEEQAIPKTANIYNYVSGKLICKDYELSGGRPPCYPWGYIRIKKNDKYNLIDMHGNALLPRGVDKIFYPTDTAPAVIPVIDRGTMWFVNENGGLLPTEDGVNFDFIDEIDFRRRPIFKYKGYQFVLTPSADANRMIVLQRSQIPDNVLADINSILFKQQAMIMEGFMRTLDMINNFYKDKN